MGQLLVGYAVNVALAARILLHPVLATLYLLLLLGFVTSCIMLAHGIRYKLDSIPHFCNSKYITEETCNHLVGYLAVYRVCFGMAAFFLLMAILTFKVKNSHDPRAAFHNGYATYVLYLLVIVIFYSYAIG